MKEMRNSIAGKATVSQIKTIWLMLEKCLGLVCALVLLAMAGLTGADVIARYVFNAPIQGAFELTEVLLVCLIFCAMPLANRAGSHVEVELWNPSGPLWKRIVLLLSLAGGAMIFAGLAYQLMEHGNKLADRGTVTNSLDIPLSHVAYLAAGCCALAVVATVISAINKDEEARC